MDAELKAKWVKALRSGEFKQARGFLQKDGGYCCLGVLCLIAGISVDRLETQEGYADIFDLIGSDEVSRGLSSLNDGSRFENLHPHTFPEIADYIEKNL